MLGSLLRSPFRGSAWALGLILLVLGGSGSA